MRPHSEIRVGIAAALVDGPGTCRQLAQRTGWSIAMTRTALDNMVRAGQAAKPRSIRVAGVKRPLPVYARPALLSNPTPAHAELSSALQGWTRWPAWARPQGAPM